MEIHPPHGSIHSYKDILLQLLIVTLGILIALSLEGLREWRHERLLVSEARENMLSEIRDNQKSLQEYLGAQREFDDQHQKALALISDLEKGKPANELYYGFSGALMAESAWSTAQATGALALMDYSEASRFAEVYKIQESYNELSVRMISQFPPSYSLVLQLMHDYKISSHELQDYKKSILSDWAFLSIQNEFGKELSKRYSKILADEK